MTRPYLLVALCASAAALLVPAAQQPLHRIESQIPIGKPTHEGDDATSFVNSVSLQERVKIGNLWKRAEKLYEIAKKGEEEYGHPTRVIGSKGHLATIEYIKSELAALKGYYNVSEQSFGAVSGSVHEFRLTIGSTVPNTTSTMGLTPPTVDKEPVFGDLILVKNSGCEKSDYPAAVDGNIAFVKRGECSFGAKSFLAGKAGARAAVIYNTDPEEIHGTLGTPSKHHVATFGLGGKEGSEYAELLLRGKVFSASAYIDADVNTIKTHNVIAQSTTGDANNCVMLGGHSDSVPEGPGINDDGSGSLSVLEVAVQLSHYRIKNCVRFAWWSAEEEGLLGSDHYVASLSEEENNKVRLFMDYDMMASPNFAYQVYNATDDTSPPGSEALRDLYINWYKDNGLNYTLIAFDGRSDYDGFIRGGIPAGGIATGAEGVKTKEEEELFGGKAGEWYDKNYHQLGDDLSNLNLTAWEVNTKLIAHSVATYAASFKGFPKRSKQASIQELPKWKYHGNKLIM
ncbi:Aminopeptidase Y [Conoideocrella luteorostrata]|uniref:Peptide hydrolase n=1 Tax=Conoideocrella luteorostrata TaxID=1105319 RepID=A0AAJ0G2T9_9HYPO|nr:Aminopeptidase Y [Conoideocrella luteorostrata]